MVVKLGVVPWPKWLRDWSDQRLLLGRNMAVSEFRSLVNSQVEAMLAAGRRLHPETFDDVSERSYRAFPKRWADQVRI